MVLLAQLPGEGARWDAQYVHVYTHTYIWEFPKIGVPYLGVLMIRILLFRVLYWGPLFSETPIFMFSLHTLIRFRVQV